MDFRPVEQNLRQSFRALASGRPKASVAELPGVTIASLGVRFQMFNAAFFSEQIESADQLAARLEVTREHFIRQRTSWSLWVCEDWLSWATRRRLARVCTTFGPRTAAELPGMIAHSLTPPVKRIPGLEIQRLRSEGDLDAFRSIGSLCFRVPPHWFGEVFALPVIANPDFECWIAKLDGEPVATAAVVPCPGAIGLYNIATVPAHRGRGIAEAVTRHVAADSRARFGDLPLVLQSTSFGLRLYERLGFRAVTRVLAYVSTP